MKVMRYLAGGLFVCGTFAAHAADVTFRNSDDIATLQDVINGCEAGDRVILEEGTYVLTATIQLTNGVTLAGVDNKQCIIKPASIFGHAFYLDESLSCLSNVTVTGFQNKSEQWGCGGGVQMQDGTVSHCIVSNNLMTGNQSRGGGIYCNGGKVRYTIIANNQCNYGGGGLFLGCHYPADRQPNHPILVERCLVFGNKNVGTSSGGGVTSENLSDTSPITLRHCTVANNTCGKMGGVYITNLKNFAALESCIFADNILTAASQATGSPNWQVGSNLETYSSVIRNCLVGNGSAAFGATDPVTGDAAFKSLVSHNYHLQATSDAIDNGLVVEEPTVDLDGYPVTDGKPDIGCYEFDFSREPFSVVLTYSADSQWEGATLSLKATPVNPPAGADLSYAWTVSDGGENVLKATGAETSVTLDNAGTYTVSLVAKNGETVLFESTGETPVPVHAHEVAVSTVAELQAAIAAAVAGQTIKVAEGSYRLTASVKLAAAATVMGAGRDKTVIDLGGVSNGSFWLYDYDAVVRDLEIRGGTSETGGVRVERGLLTAARISRCRVKNANRTSATNIFAPVAIFSSGTVDGCEIFFCTNTCPTVARRNASLWTYTAAGAVGVGGKMRNTLVYSNSCDWCCAIVKAGASQAGAATIDNCTVTDNLSEGANAESVAMLASNGSHVKNVICAGNRSPNWTSTAFYTGTVLVSQPNWGANGAAGAGYSNNCWGESAETYGAACADGSKVRFLDPAAGNWRISVLSSCYDAGELDASWMTDATDLDGNPRVFHKNRVDIGCYESQDVKGLMMLVQ